MTDWHCRHSRPSSYSWSSPSSSCRNVFWHFFWKAVLIARRFLYHVHTKLLRSVSTHPSSCEHRVSFSFTAVSSSLQRTMQSCRCTSIETCGWKLLPGGALYTTSFSDSKDKQHWVLLWKKKALFSLFPLPLCPSHPLSTAKDSSLKSWVKKKQKKTLTRERNLFCKPAKPFQKNRDLF